MRREVAEILAAARSTQDACIPWPGRPMVSVCGVRRHVRAFACVWAKGPAKGNCRPAASCGHPTCINGRHLYWEPVPHGDTSRRLDADTREALLSMLGAGQSPAFIAQTLGVSVKQVRYYRKRLNAQ